MQLKRTSKCNVNDFEDRQLAQYGNNFCSSLLCTSISLRGSSTVKVATSCSLCSFHYCPPRIDVEKKESELSTFLHDVFSLSLTLVVGLKGIATIAILQICRESRWQLVAIAFSISIAY